MRLLSWTVSEGFLPLVLVLFLNVFVHVKADKPKERHYYIAAVEIEWTYSGTDTRHGSTYKKVVFREYEAGFRQAKTHPAQLGLLGPTLRAEEGETLVVTFKNMAKDVFSIHPHGVGYGKQSEGALYFDNTSEMEKEDDRVPPNREHVYYWEVTADVSPQTADPACLTYSYVSHNDFVSDYNSGLIGALLVCKPGSLDESGKQIGFHHEFVFLFGVFDEKESKHRPKGHSADDHVKYTINGYTHGALPDVSVCAHAPTSLHLLAMGSEPEVFSVHVNGQVLVQTGHKMSSVGLISGASATASLTALHPGRWIISSHTVKHMEAGLYGYMDVKTCEGFTAPHRRLTSKQRRESKKWTYYIAAEEVEWDYAPHQDDIDEDFKQQYLTQSPTRIGGRYRKAVYTLYTNESFSERSESKQRKNELGILGPVIRAQVNDIITIVFKNKASRPYSIYPHGLTMDKTQEGVNYPPGGNHSHGVPPGETHTYVWEVVLEDEPLEEDFQCLTRMYHSAVDTPRDIASGLIGPLLICKSQSLSVRNVQLKADKEQHAMLAVFDENKSWYLEHNIRQYCDRSKVNRADKDFHKANIKHTINGYMFGSGPKLGFCNGEVVTWHVSSIGAQDYFQSATFYGHSFKLNDRSEDSLSLYPMTGETITMDMDNKGFWLMATLTSHETMRGMHLKFQDVECYKDTFYEYSDERPDFTVWNPLSLDDLVEKQEKATSKPAVVEEKEEQAEPIGGMDLLTYAYANELGLRSRKNSSSSDAEQLDLSFLDYDAVDVPNGDTNITHNGTNAKENTENSITKPPALNNTLAFDLNGLNHTETPKNATTNSNDSKVVSGLNGYVTQADTNNTVDDVTALLMVQNASAEIANLTVTLSDDSSNILETDRVNWTLNADPNATIGINSTGDSEEKLTRGDVFENGITATSGPAPEDGTNHSLSEMLKLLRKLDLNILKINSEIFSKLERGLPTNSSENVTVPSDRSFVNITQIDLKGAENVTASLGNLNDTTSSPESFSNETLGRNLTKTPVKTVELSVSDSSSEEEIVIYLKENNKREGIKTTPVKTQDHYWTYNVTQDVEPIEIPDHVVKKYFEPTTTTTAPPPKKKTKITIRHRPEKGKGLKTKKRKEYKPESRSGFPSLTPLSPRGVNPFLSPRGARPSTLGLQPYSDEADLINKPVVIGVPRPDFSNYDIYVPGDELQEPDLTADEYEYVSVKDPYSGNVDIKALNQDEVRKYQLKHSGANTKLYFIAAEEVEWDYMGYGTSSQEKSQLNSRETKFAKVVFRAYTDSSFTIPDVRGQIDEHLGIMGPVLKMEVGQSLMIAFKNNARRPYSLHPNGVYYTKHAEGLNYEDGSNYWDRYDNEVQPNDTFTYIWKANANVGPKPDESQCRTWVYYSGVNPEKDIQSGLIGPLLVCRKETPESPEPPVRQFMLLFMTFDESQSWYYEKNLEMMQRRKRSRIVTPPPKDHLKFHSINGIIYNLKGLRMYTNQLVAWHLLNMGSPRDFHSVHFHGQTFLHKKNTDHRHAVYPLLPGSFATLEMIPSKVGLWQLETQVGLRQKLGMQTLFLVIDDECSHPLGLESGSVKDEQIKAFTTRGYWEPHLARLNNAGKYNAWSTGQNYSWIQVDFQRPVLVSQVATQGAWQTMRSQFVEKYAVSYSDDRRKWIYYKGDSIGYRKVFNGNTDANEVKTNTFFPPLIGRYFRLHPIDWYNTATVRMEYYGCQLDGCSVPLGMESGLIWDQWITASSMASSWYSGPWRPSLGRLNKQGTINAWQAKSNDQNQWLQVELPQMKKITGIITQGAKALGKEMFVVSYMLKHSEDGVHWDLYTGDEDIPAKTFVGNSNNNDHVRNYIYPPIFARFVRILPRTWSGSITMRVELLGCDYE